MACTEAFDNLGLAEPIFSLLSLCFLLGSLGMEWDDHYQGQEGEEEQTRLRMYYTPTILKPVGSDRGSARYYGSGSCGLISLQPPITQTHTRAHTQNGGGRRKMVLHMRKSEMVDSARASGRVFREPA